MKKLTTLAIIGAGQIGSRHLQALCQLDRPTNIELVDPSEDSLLQAKSRAAEVKSINVKNIKFLNEITKLSEIIDLAIISTNSDVRREVTEKLLNKKEVKNLILEKVVFQKPQDFKSISELFKKKKVRAWVNCPRRTWQIYKNLKKMLSNSNSIQINVTGSDFNLASNAIHFIDLAAFLVNSDELEIKNDLLDQKELQSKRRGFVEFTGTLYGKVGKKSFFSISSYKEGTAPILAQISSNKLRFLLSESTGDAWLSKENENWVWSKLRTKIPLQSQLTHLVAQQIFDTQRSDLPTYGESWQLHVPLLASFRQHLEKIRKRKLTLCPIT